MIFRQLFDSVSGTYSYLLASRAGGEALILDPVLEKADRYCQLLRELDLRLVKAVDTHLHADHVTGLGELRDRTQCITIMGEQSKADVVSMRVSDGDKVMIEGLSLDVMYTPGHTDDSYSYLMGDRVFTGDTLLIRGTGRTDFQNGSARAQYDSIFNRLLKLPDETMVFPAHDYKGDTVSTIGEEKRYNPRLQVRGDRRICRADEQSQSAESETDGRGAAGQHACRPASGRSRQAGPRADRARRHRQSRPARHPAGRSARETASAPSTARCRARCMRPTPASPKACGRAACCAKSRPRPDAAWCSSAPSANARRWRSTAAKNAGLANTAHIEGGIDAWKKAGGPVVMG